MSSGGWGFEMLQRALENLQAQRRYTEELTQAGRAIRPFAQQGHPMTYYDQPQQPRQPVQRSWLGGTADLGGGGQVDPSQRPWTDVPMPESPKVSAADYGVPEGDQIPYRAPKDVALLQPLPSPTADTSRTRDQPDEARNLVSKYRKQTKQPDINGEQLQRVTDNWMSKYGAAGLDKLRSLISTTASAEEAPAAKPAKPPAPTRTFTPEDFAETPPPTKASGAPTPDQLQAAHDASHIETAIKGDPKKPPPGPPLNDQGMFPYESTWGRGFTFPQLVYNLVHAGASDKEIGEAMHILYPMLNSAAQENFHQSMEAMRQYGIDVGERKAVEVQTQKDIAAQQRTDTRVSAYLEIQTASQAQRAGRYNDLRNLAYDRLELDKRKLLEKNDVDRQRLDDEALRIAQGNRRISTQDQQRAINEYFRAKSNEINIVKAQIQNMGALGAHDQELNAALAEQMQQLKDYVNSLTKANQDVPDVPGITQ